MSYDINLTYHFLRRGTSVEVAYAMVDPRTGRQRRVARNVTVNVPAGMCRPTFKDEAYYCVVSLLRLWLLNLI